VSVLGFFCFLVPVRECGVQMTTRTTDEASKEVECETIESLNLEGELSGEIGDHLGSCLEGLTCFGDFVPPIRCAGCNYPLMLSTFYNGQHECDGVDVQRRGRVVLCGSFDHHQIRRHELRHVPPPNGVFDMFRVSRDYYCSDTCSSECSEETILEVDCENPFVRTICRGPDRSELMQDRVQRLNCPENCKGQCLLDACVRVADDTFNSKKHCPDCKRSFWVRPVDKFKEFMERAEKGVIDETPNVLICGNIKCSRGECSRCDEHVDMFGDHMELPDPEGCTGPGCDGRCLDRYVKNYIVPRSLKRAKE
jgi:hypothetical protein